MDQGSLPDLSFSAQNRRNVKHQVMSMQPRQEPKRGLFDVKNAGPIVTREFNLTEESATKEALEKTRSNLKFSVNPP